jgi:hypothetical protein
MAADFEDSQERIAAAAARSAEFQNMVRDWNMRNQVAFLPGILGQGKATADFYTNQPRTMFVSDRFQPQGVQEYQGGNLADIVPWTGLPEEGDGRDDGLADEEVAPTDPVILVDPGGTSTEDGGNDFITTPDDLVPIVSEDSTVDSKVFDTIAGRGGGFDPRTDIGQFLRGLDLNPTIDIDFLTEAIANSTAGMGGPDDWMSLANKIMGQGLYEGDAARSFTGPIGDYATDQGDESRLYTGPIGSYGTDQGDELRSFTGPIGGYATDQGDELRSYIGPIGGYATDQGDELRSYTGPIGGYGTDQGDELRSYTGPIGGYETDQGDQFRSYTGPIGGYGTDQGDEFRSYIGPIGGYGTDQGDELRPFTGPIGGYGTDQGDELRSYTGPIGGYGTDQGDELRSYTGPIGGYGTDQGDELRSYTGPIGGYGTDQGDELRSYTGPIVSEDQGLSPDQFTNAPIGGNNPILDDRDLRGLVTDPTMIGDDLQGVVTDPTLLEGMRGPVSKADFGVPNLEDLMGQYAGDYTPPVPLAQFDDETLDRLTRQQGEGGADVLAESPIEQILMDVRTGTLPAEDAVAELVTIGLPKTDAINIIISQTEGLTSGIPGVIG